MIVGIVSIQLHIPAAHSLKDKRRVIQAVIARMHERHRVSVAETAHHDAHQRAEIGVAAVGKSESEVERLLEHLRAEIEMRGDALVTRWEPQILEDLA
jgi:uncharacterized protein YlxP (DUF503 family)